LVLKEDQGGDGFTPPVQWHAGHGEHGKIFLIVVQLPRSADFAQ
jgi:hypothetical protein